MSLSLDLLASASQMNSSDSEVVQFHCPVTSCGRSLPSQQHLLEHCRASHQGVKPHSCDFSGCGKSFLRPAHLVIHRRIHTGDKPFVCPFEGCDKRWNQKSALKQHLRCHTGEKPFHCKVHGCNKSFSTSSSCKRHMLIHQPTSNSNSSGSESDSSSNHDNDRQQRSRGIITGGDHQTKLSSGVVSHDALFPSNKSPLLEYTTSDGSSSSSSPVSSAPGSPGSPSSLFFMSFLPYTFSSPTVPDPWCPKQSIMGDNMSLLGAEGEEEKRVVGGSDNNIFLAKKMNVNFLIN